MPDFDADFEDLDQKFESLFDREHELVQGCLYRSAIRLAGEIRRLAKAEQRIMPYLKAGFTIMNHASELFDPASARDQAIELIGLLESEDRARAIQPDLPEDEYSHAVGWMSACAYDNLAKATASLHGYNSDGMHQCIGEGIQVCRRTGKLECVRCFREYATDVYVAADDLDMALHFARAGVAQRDSGPHDRRFVGAEDVATIQILQGDLEAALETNAITWEMARLYHSPRSAFLRTRVATLELYHLFGDPARGERVAAPATGDERPTAADLEDPPPGEDPSHEMLRDQALAVAACCGGDYQNALAKLEKWDRLLVEKGELDTWFGNRLRLLATCRLAGNDRDLERLAVPLEKKAQGTRDWLTLRRLKRLLDPSTAPAPVSTIADFRVGPFAAKTSATMPADMPIAAESTAAVTAEATPSSSDSNTPPDYIAAFWDRMVRASQRDDGDSEIAAILHDLLAIDPKGVKDLHEANWLIHTARYVVGDCSTGREVWQWAQSVVEPWKSDATAISLMATLGTSLRFGPNEELEDLVSVERLEAMFRESIDLDPHKPRNFTRAGKFFAFMENLGEAERCYARGFRLERSDPQLALALAEIYTQTDRKHDTLAALDMCLREGTDEPEVAWQAAISAFQLDQFESALTYLDRREELAPGAEWTNYYRASSLLDLDRPAEALAAAEEEARRNPDCPFGPQVLIASAVGALGRVDEFRERLRAVLDAPLAEVDYLSKFGLAALLRRLWISTSCLPKSDRLRTELEDRLLAAGLSPNDLYEPVRRARKKVEGLNTYEVLLVQPLDERWQSFPGRLHGQEDWTHYAIPWLVLARNEKEAINLVMPWQSRCYPLPAEVIEVSIQSEDYTDSPGVVWQGWRDNVEPAEEGEANNDEDSFDDDNDDDDDDDE